ncbi:MAG: type II toxin-antitoxin system YafQ family toxin [Patescibacteria group bacterium]
MYNLKYSAKFKKDLKKISRNNNLNLLELECIIDLLADNKNLKIKYQNHKLKGEFKNCYECHIKPDVLLIYEIDKKNSVIYFLRLGSHSKLF